MIFLPLQQFDSHLLEKKFEKRFKKILHNPEKVLTFAPAIERDCDAI
jgi:hypothetical protein